MTVPFQNRYIDPYSSYNSKEVSKLTRLITSGKNKICRENHLIPSFFYTINIDSGSTVYTGDIYSDSSSVYEWKIEKVNSDTEIEVIRYNGLLPASEPNMGEWSLISGEGDSTIITNSYSFNTDRIAITGGIAVMDDIVLEIGQGGSSESEDRVLDTTSEDSYILDDGDTVPPSWGYIILQFLYEKVPSPTPASFKIVAEPVPSDFKEREDYLFLAKVNFNNSELYLEDSVNDIYRSELNLTDQYDGQQAFNDIKQKLNSSNSVSWQIADNIKALVKVDNNTIQIGSSGLELKSLSIGKDKILSSSFGNGIVGGSGSLIRLGALSSNWNLGSNSNTIINVPDPVEPHHVANKSFIEGKLKFIELTDLESDTYDGNENKVPVVDSTSGLNFKKISDINIDSAANISWNKINKTGSSLSDIGKPTENFDFNYKRIYNLRDPIHPRDAATKHYTDLNIDRDIKKSCKLTTISDLNASSSTSTSLSDVGNLNDSTSIDFGISLESGDRILVKNQDNNVENGIYVVSQIGDSTSSWILERSEDFDEDVDVTGTALISVSSGNLYSSTLWIQTEYYPDADSSIIGSQPLNFENIGSWVVSDFSNTQDLVVEHGTGSYPVVYVIELKDSSGNPVDPPEKIQTGVEYIDLNSFKIIFDTDSSLIPQKVRVLYS